MPNSVLNQLKALRDGVAQDLRKDPRYLTLQALDKSIEEISTMLTGAGLLPASAPATSLSQRLGGLAPQSNPYAEPAAVLGTDADAASQSAASPEHGESPARPTPGFKDGTAGFPHPAVPHHALPPFSEPALEVAGAVAEDAAGVFQGQPWHEAKAHFEAPVFEPEHVTVEAGPGYALAEAGTEPPAQAGAPEEIEAEATTLEPHEAHAAFDEAGIEPVAEEASWHPAALEPHAEAEVPAEAHETEEAAGEESPDDLSAFDRRIGEALASETLAAAVAAAILEEEAAQETAGHPAGEARAETLAQSYAIEEAPRNEWPEEDETDSATVSALSALAAALFQEEVSPAPAEYSGSGAQDEAGAEAGDAGYEPSEALAGAADAEPAAPKDSLTADLEAALEEWAAEAAALEGGEQSGAEAAGEPSAPHALAAGETLADATEPAFETTAAFESIVADAIAAALFPEETLPARGEDLETETDGESTAPHALTRAEALEEALEDAIEEALQEAEDAEEAAELAFETIVADAIAAALFPEEAEAGQHFETEAAGASGTSETEVPGESPGEPSHGETGEHAFETALANAMAAALLSGDDEAAHAAPATDEAGAEAREEAEAPVSRDFGEQPEEPAAAVFPEGKASGYIPMAPKTGAPQYSPSIAVKFGKLPGRVDLRPLLAPIEDQGQINSSVANAVASAYEYWIRKATKKPQNISRQFVYYNARWRAGTQDSDSGCAIQLALEGLQKFGACAESAWPSNPQLLTKRPGAEAYRDGAPYRIHDIAQVPLKLEAWKQALAEGKPVIFGLALFDSFAGCASSGGVVPMPAPDDVPHKAHREHAMCAVGYSEPERVFIVRNSWGEAFGDKGYCYIPFDYLLNPKFNDGDNWIFVPKVPAQPPRETWQDSQTPVTNGGKGVDFPIEPYRIEDYEAVSTDLFEQTRRPWNAHVTEDYSDYAGKVGKNSFDELESFDVTSFLAATGHHADSGSPAEGGDDTSGAAAAADDDGEWGNAAAWGVSTALDHGDDPAKHEATGSGTADAELTHSLP